MEDSFLCGVLLGMLGGALVATNSQKARQMVKDGQEQVKEKVEKLAKSKKKMS
jgi:hypothetical protein